jgi:hypothetical protein
MISGSVDARSAEPLLEANEAKQRASASGELERPERGRSDRRRMVHLDERNARRYVSSILRQIEEGDAAPWGDLAALPYEPTHRQ